MSPIPLLTTAISAVSHLSMKGQAAAVPRIYEGYAKSQHLADTALQHATKLTQYILKGSETFLSTNRTKPSFGKISPCTGTQNPPYNISNSTATHTVIHSGANMTDTDMWISYGCMAASLLVILVLRFGIHADRQLQAVDHVEERVGLELRLRTAAKYPQKMCDPCQKRADSKEKGELDEKMVVLLDADEKPEVVLPHVERMIFQTEEREEDRGVYTMWPNGPWRG